MSAASTDLDVVQRFHSIVGIGHLYKIDRASGKQLWSWNASGIEDALYLFGLIGSFLGERRRSRALEVIDEAQRDTGIPHPNPSRRQSPETIARRSAALKGKQRSYSVREKMRKAQQARRDRERAT